MEITLASPCDSCFGLRKILTRHYYGQFVCEFASATPVKLISIKLMRGVSRRCRCAKRVYVNDLTISNCRYK